MAWHSMEKSITHSTMNLLKIVTSGIAATTAMSAFSYLVSEEKKKNFREPEVLGTLLKRRVSGLSKPAANAVGWGAHYGTGLVFAGLYDQLWKKTTVKPTVLSGAVLGAASGLAGILIWKATVALHPDPPVKAYKKYHKHLFLAHIVFGIAAAQAYRCIPDTTEGR